MIFLIFYFIIISIVLPPYGVLGLWCCQNSQESGNNQHKPKIPWSFLSNTKRSSFSWNKLLNSNINKKLNILIEALKFAYGQAGSGKTYTMNALPGSKPRGAIVL